MKDLLRAIVALIVVWLLFGLVVWVVREGMEPHPERPEPNPDEWIWQP